MTGLASHMVIASIVVCGACNASKREPPPTHSRRDVGAEVS